MSTYTPSNPQGFDQRQEAWLRQELKTLRESMERAEPFLYLRVLHAQPERVFAGMIVIADGTDWDPGSGVGVYYRDESNSSWNFLG